MMSNRCLYLLRHAKSSWDDPTLDDHARPLAARGEKAVKRLRRHVKEAGIAPDLVLCSSSVRTRMTLDGILPALPAKVVTTIDADLYAAPADQLLDRLRAVPDEMPTVMLIGHNPGLEDLATTLIGAGDESLRRTLDAKFPTGALVTLTFTGPWSALNPGSATLTAFVLPRDLQ